MKLQSQRIHEYLTNKEYAWSGDISKLTEEDPNEILMPNKKMMTAVLHRFMCSFVSPINKYSGNFK